MLSATSAFDKTASAFQSAYSRIGHPLKCVRQRIFCPHCHETLDIWYAFPFLSDTSLTLTWWSRMLCSWSQLTWSYGSCCTCVYDDYMMMGSSNPCWESQATPYCEKRDPILLHIKRWRPKHSARVKPLDTRAIHFHGKVPAKMHFNPFPTLPVQDQWQLIHTHC